MASLPNNPAATYRCPACQAALMARVDPDRPWLRCPGCGRAVRPPDPSRPSRMPKPMRPAAEADVGPELPWQPPEMQRFSPRRIALALGVFVGGGMIYDSILPATFRPTLNMIEAIVGAVLTAVSVGLLGLQSRAGRPPRR